MAFKSKVKNHIKVGNPISIHHSNGFVYDGIVIDVDSSNPADMSLIIEDYPSKNPKIKRERYIMSITAAMGVIAIPISNEQEEEIIENEEPERLRHEPSTIEKRKQSIKVTEPAKKKRSGSRFIDKHAPDPDRKVTRRN